MKLLNQWLKQHIHVYIPTQINNRTTRSSRKNLITQTQNLYTTQRVEPNYPPSFEYMSHHLLANTPYKKANKRSGFSAGNSLIDCAFKMVT
jgi:hypothetical protein